MRDARRRYRHVVDRFLPVYERSSGKLVGYLTDVNVEGGMIESREAMDEQSTLALRIELGEPIDEALTIDLDARCVWTRKPRNNYFYCTGFQFSDVGPEQRQQLETLAERYRLAAAE